VNWGIAAAAWWAFIALLVMASKVEEAGAGRVLYCTAAGVEVIIIIDDDVNSLY
jgi:hypothetical protein